MKRTSSQQEESTSDGTAAAAATAKMPRQIPASCKNCRVKKLRCDRATPCGNCSARGLDCEYVEGRKPRRSPQAKTGGSSGGDHAGADDVRSRLDNLEQLLASIVEHRQGGASGGTGQPSQPHNQALYAEGVPKEEPIGDEVEARMQDLTETILSTFTPFSVQTRTVKFLTISVVPIRHMVTLPQAPTLEAYLPTMQEASLLLEDYIQNIEYIQRLVNIPQIRINLQTLYGSLAANASVAPARVALFMAIFANSAARSSLLVNESSRPSADQSRRLAALWQRTAIEILERLIRTRPVVVSMEQLQATLILSHPANYLEDLSAGFRHLHLGALNIAREMRIHQIDSPAAVAARRYASIDELVDVEMKRRLWWHLVATDWLISYVSGPQEHIYNIHPAHFSVDMPLNADDSQLPFLLSPSTGATRPSATQPTEMSFQLPRIQIGIICRDMVDALPHSDADIERLTARLQKLIADTSDVWCLNSADDNLSRATLAQRPYLPLQSKVFVAGVQYRVMELNRPRLLRRQRAAELDQTTRQRVAGSRATCIEAARAVVTQGIGVADVWLLGAFVHHYFMAAAVLAMDLHAGMDSDLGSFARPPPLRAQHAEVQRAYDVMKRMKREYGAVDRLVKPLLEVLKRAAEQEKSTAAASSRAEARSTAYSSGSGQSSASDALPDDFDAFSDLLAMTGSGFDDDGFNMFLSDLDSDYVF